MLQWAGCGHTGFEGVVDVDHTSQVPRKGLYKFNYEHYHGGTEKDGKSYDSPLRLPNWCDIVTQASHMLFESRATRTEGGFWGFFMEDQG